MRVLVTKVYEDGHGVRIEYHKLSGIKYADDIGCFYIDSTVDRLWVKIVGHSPQAQVLYGS